MGGFSSTNAGISGMLAMIELQAKITAYLYSYNAQQHTR